MQGNSTSETEVERSVSNPYEIGFPFWKIVEQNFRAMYYPLEVLLRAIIQPGEPKYFIYSSVITMLLDPLFLYVPLINEERKCLVPDRALMITAVILRVVTDLRYVSKILYKIVKRWRRYKGRQNSNDDEDFGITSNLVAIIPIPQVAILVFLPNMRGFGSLIVMKFLNSLIFLQYVQRAYPIYRYCKNLNKELHDKSSNITQTWIPSLINLLIYLLASYVVGTFWYFFSVQREIDCWKDACQRGKFCEFDVRCDNHAFRNVAFLNTSCPIKSPDETIYDFGIFLNALQSGMHESTDVLGKFLKSFSWGIRNLSSFASNLNTSNYRWEILFAVAISISGLILFIYFLGHVQTFTQAAGKLERSCQKWNEILKPKVKSLVSEYQLHAAEDSVMLVVKKKHSEDPDFVLKNMFSIFSSFKQQVLDEQRQLGSNQQKEPSLQVSLNKIRETLFLEKLNKLVLGLGFRMDESVLKEICKHLDPLIYAEGSYIIREGEPLDVMFFITQGSAISYTTDHSVTTRPSMRRLMKEEWYGEELLSWAISASTSISFSDLPNSRSTVKAHQDVELFVLRAAELKGIFHPHQQSSGNLPTAHTWSGRNGHRSFPLQNRISPSQIELPAYQ